MNLRHALALLAVLLLYGLASEMDYRYALATDAIAEERRAQVLARLAAAETQPSASAAATHR